MTSWEQLKGEIESELTGDLTRGNHIAVIAPTGGGKTTLTTKGLLPMFDDMADVLLIDSTADPKLSSYGKPYQRYGKIKGLRRLTIGDMTAESISKVFNALNRAYKQGGTVIVFDEVRHITDGKYLGLAAPAEQAWLFSRKRRNIVVGLTQAPRYVPSAFYDQSKLHFIFKIRDKRAMLRLAEIGGDYDAIKSIAPSLRKFEFCYVNPEGDVTTSKFELPKPPQPQERRARVSPGLATAVPQGRLRVRRS